MPRLWLAGPLAAYLTLSFAPCAGADTAAPVRSASRAAAERWLARAEQLALRGDTAAAITCYTEALRTDSTLGEAYLGLAEIRRLFGDRRESEWLLTRAAALPDSRAEALSRRARLFVSLGRDAQAFSDLENAALADPSPRRQRELADWFVSRRAWAAALGVWRRIRARLPEPASESERQEADDTVAALSWLAAETDAAQHDAGESGWVRRALRRRAQALARAGSPR